MANMFACADMIYGGVMERFPKLKVAYLEGNCAWIPWLLWRMGEYAELTGMAEHRSEEHTSELQSLTNLVCRLLLEKKKNNKKHRPLTQTELDMIRAQLVAA